MTDTIFSQFQGSFHFFLPKKKQQQINCIRKFRIFFPMDKIQFFQLKKKNCWIWKWKCLVFNELNNHVRLFHVPVKSYHHHHHRSAKKNDLQNGKTMCVCVQYWCLLFLFWFEFFCLLCLSVCVCVKNEKNCGNNWHTQFKLSSSSKKNWYISL